MRILQTFYGLTSLQITLLLGVITGIIAVASYNVVGILLFFCFWVGGKHFASSLKNKTQCLDSRWLIPIVRGIDLFVDHIKEKYWTGKAAEKRVIQNYYTISKQPDAPKVPKEECNAIQSYILRDFVISWFSTISEDDTCVTESRNIINHLSDDLFNRLKFTDKHWAIQKGVHLYRCHLKNFQTARLKWLQQPTVRKKNDPTKTEFKRLKTIEDAFNHIRLFHVAMETEDTEILYMKMIVNAILQTVLSSELNQCYVAKDFIAEVLSHKLLYSVVSLIQKPYWLHKTIIKVFSDDDQIIVDPNLENKIDRVSPSGNMNINSATPSTTVDADPSSINTRTPESQESARGQHNTQDPSSDIMSSPLRKRQERVSSKEEFLTLTSLLIFPEAADGQAPFTQPSSTNRRPPDARKQTTSSDPRPVIASTSTSDRPSFYIQESDAISIKSASSGGSTAGTSNLPERECPDGASYIPSSSIPVQTSAKGERQSSKSPERKTSSVGGLFFTDVFGDEPREVGIREYAGQFEQSTSDTAQPTSGPTHISSGLEDSPKTSETSHQQPASSYTSRTRLDSCRTNPNVDDAIDAFVDLEGATHEPPEILFAELSIVRTEERREISGIGSGVFTLYCMECLAWHETGQGSWILQPQVVKRRYREFLTLQERLEEHPKYKKSMKGIKGPSRWTALPFGNKESRTVNRRKEFLEEYLKKLISHAEIGNSMAVREFLAYDGDASIAFVKKAPEIPRPDKMIVKTVSGVFKKLTDVLPTGDKTQPTIERVNSRIKQRKQPEKLDLNIGDWDDGDNLSLLFKESDSETDSEDEVAELVCTRSVDLSGSAKRSTAQAVEAQDEFSDAVDKTPSPGTPRLEGDGCDITKLDKDDELDTVAPLSSTVLELAEQSIIDKDTWVRKLNIVHIFKVLLLQALETWFKEEIDDVTTTPRCAYYIRLLCDTVWPNGELDQTEEIEPNEEQKRVTKDQARQVLHDFFPDFIPIIIGREQFEYSIEQILDSVQHKSINRHFALCLIDCAVETLFPEVKTTELQRELLQANNHERRHQTYQKLIKLEHI